MKSLFCHVVREYDNGVISIIGGNHRDTIYLGDVLELDSAPEVKVTLQQMEFLGKRCNDLPISHKAMFYFLKDEYPVAFQAGDYLASRHDAPQPADSFRNRDIHFSIENATLIREDKERSMADVWDENGEFINIILGKLEDSGLIKKNALDRSYSRWCREGPWQGSWEALPFLQKEVSDTTSNDRKLILVYLMTYICKDWTPDHLSFVDNFIDLLVIEFERTTNYWMRSRLSRFIGNIVDESTVSNVITLLKKRQYRLSRWPMLHGLSRMKCRQSFSCLIDLLEDPYICDFAIIALGARKERAANNQITLFLHGDDNWLRLKARWALRTIYSVGC